MCIFLLLIRGTDKIFPECRDLRILSPIPRLGQQIHVTVGAFMFLFNLFFFAVHSFNLHVAAPMCFRVT